MQTKRLRLAQSAEKIEHGGAGVEERKIANAKRATALGRRV
jgi:hypothetical protein